LGSSWDNLKQEFDCIRQKINGGRGKLEEARFGKRSLVEEQAALTEAYTTYKSWLAAYDTAQVGERKSLRSKNSWQ